MKKFLTVLLALSVVFTYSFGTVFAAENYSASEVATALNAEIANQVNYLNNAKTQALATYSYDADTGFEETGDKYFKAAYEAAADALIADAKSKMEASAREAANAVTSDGVASIDLTKVTKFTAEYPNGTSGSDILVAANFKAEMEKVVVSATDSTKVLDATQEPLTKAYYLDKIAKDYALDLYSDTTKYNDGMTPTIARDFVQKYADVATEGIKDDSVDSNKNAAQKMEAYASRFSTFTTAIANVKTIEEEKLAEGEYVKTVEQQLAAMKSYAIEDFYARNKIALTATFPIDVTASGAYTHLSDANNNVDKAIFEKGTNNAVKVFGTSIANAKAVTKAEATAYNDALYNYILKSIDVAKIYAGTDTSKVAALYKTEAADPSDDGVTYFKVLCNSILVAEKYADVVKYGTNLKSEYSNGVKVYDDTKVDAAVKAAEEFVYGDLGGTLGTDVSYIIEAADDINSNSDGLKNLKLVESEQAKLEAAIADAKAKFAPSVTKYGADKTAEADIKYCKDQYASAAYTDYEEIKTDAHAALTIAKSYADIEKIMSDAAADLAKLMLAADATDVSAAISNAKTALEKYAEEQYNLLSANDKAKYDGAPTTSTSAWGIALQAGKDLIEEAVTVAGVSSAYAEAQSLIKNVKTKDQVAELKKAAESLINALPLKANLALADKSKIEAARAADEAYKAVAGSYTLIHSVLTDAEKKWAELQKEDLDEKEDAFDDKKAAAGTGDAGVAALVAMKAEAEALLGEMSAYNDFIDAVEEIEASVFDVTTDKYDDSTLYAWVNGLSGVYAAETQNVQALINKALKADATFADVKAAVDAFKALTERQQFELDGTQMATYAKALERKLVESVTTLKLKASTKKVGKKIEVTIKGFEDIASVDGAYIQLWKSKNAVKWSFSKRVAVTATSTYITKPYKGKTYVKFRVVTVNEDGTKNFSAWSNLGCRIVK